MSHYDLTDWTDYSRGVVPAETASAMAHHLGHCALCASVANLLQRAAEAGQADRAFGPPAELVAAAEQIFPGAASTVKNNLWTGLHRLTGSLRWDSLAGPLPAGIRSLRPDSRQLTYSAGRYSVDLWFCAEPGLDAVTLTGQIADQADPETPMGGLNALLLAGDRPIVNTSTTEFGEFSLRYTPAGNLRLFIPVERTGEVVDVALIPFGLKAKPC